MLADSCCSAVVPGVQNADSVGLGSQLADLPFGATWNRELQRSERYLPSCLQGRMLSARIYRDSEALRRAQLKSLATYQSYLRAKHEQSPGEE